MTQAVVHGIGRARELGLLGTLRRVWERVTDELTLRGRSLWWGWMARRKMTDAALLARTTGAWQSVDALLDHLDGRPGSSFLLPHSSPEETVPFLHRYYPEHVSAVLDEADAACQNKLTVLGHVVHQPQGIDWNSEPLTGWRWPLWHMSRLYHRYLWLPTRPADLILSWEMNRHPHFAILGIAYWLTGDQRYVDAFISHIRSWIETNPLQHGINWCYGLEVSIRLIAWSMAFQFFRGAARFREQVGSIFLKSLFQQTDFLTKHLQTTWQDVPNNHLIAEATGLALIGATFPEFRAAATWREMGLRLLNEQAVAQTHPDGVNKEQATGYHRFITDLLLTVVALGRRGILPCEPILEDTLERMLDYVLYAQMPDGTVPMWGDSDYGRALGLGHNKDYWDFRPLLSAGAALFGRADWKFAAGHFDEEAFWLLGPEGLAAWERLDAHPPEQVSRAFPHAGLYIIRDTWAADTDVGVFRCGPFGLGGEGYCAHAHCDLLSMVLWVGGRALLVDPGTYTYHGTWRDLCRLTGAHNTLMVDGQEQARPRNDFAWQGVPQAECLVWEEKRVVGAMQAAPGVWHWREIGHPRDGVWEVTDHLTGSGVHDLSWFFHFAPDLSLRWCDLPGQLLVEELGNPYLMVMPPVGVQVHIKTGWYSPRYGHKEPNPLLTGTWHGEIPIGGVDFGWEFCTVQKAEANEQ